MITTKDLGKKKEGVPKKLKIVTTKTVDVTSDIKEGPFEPSKGPIVTTHDLPKFQAQGKKIRAMEKARATAEKKRKEKARKKAEADKKKKAKAEAKKK